MVLVASNIELETLPMNLQFGAGSINVYTHGYEIKGAWITALRFWFSLNLGAKLKWWPERKTAPYNVASPKVGPVLVAGSLNC